MFSLFYLVCVSQARISLSQLHTASLNYEEQLVYNDVHDGLVMLNKLNNQEPHVDGYRFIVYIDQPLLSLSLSLLSLSLRLGLLKGMIQWKAHEGKVFSLKWTTGGGSDTDLLLFSCGPSGAVVSGHDVVCINAPV